VSCSWQWITPSSTSHCPTLNKKFATSTSDLQWVVDIYTVFFAGLQSLAQRLEGLVKASDPQRRGYDFETLVGDLFRSLHFTVVTKPGSATPRQVDLLATRGSEAYLI
jgi:hypothetical protein